MTPNEAADAFEAAHADDDPSPCPDTHHQWSDWGFNDDGSAEYRLCAACGGMEQQWIESWLPIAEVERLQGGSDDN